MIELFGKYNSAKIFQSEIDGSTREQVQRILDQPFVEGSKIRIMPDCHAGVGCVIGTTMTIENKVCPNLVGVDIGCGMLTVSLGKRDIDLEKLDWVMHNLIPSGMNVNDHALSRFDFERMYCYDSLSNFQRLRNSLGSLGGGNHFVEIDEDTDGNRYLVIHTGSRNLGKQVAEIYQELAYEIQNRTFKIEADRIDAIVNRCVQEGRKQDISREISEFRRNSGNVVKVDKDVCFLTGYKCNVYLNDMSVCQEFAKDNRELIANIILSHLYGLGLESFERFETIHNYIDLEKHILRKGAIDCSKGKKVLIPINMRDGSIIAVGKGNEDYNCSGPHGAGRLMSRSEARKNISIEDFKKSMEGIYTTCVNQSTIDESAFAYKSIDSVLPWIEQTCDVVKVIKPIYNFKASE